MIWLENSEAITEEEKNKAKEDAKRYREEMKNLKEENRKYSRYNSSLLVKGAQVLSDFVDSVIGLFSSPETTEKPEDE